MNSTVVPRRQGSASSKLNRIFRNDFFSSWSAKAGICIIAGIALLIVLGTFFWHDAPMEIYGVPNSPPSLTHPFGTDFQGHDLLSQIIWGAYPSLVIALYASGVSTIIGFIAGVFAGYYNRLEPVLGGIADIVLSIPALALLVITGTIFLAQNYFVIGTLMILVLWAPAARALRAQVQSVKKLRYISAAKTSGLKDIQIVSKVIMPEVAPIGIAYFIIHLALAIVIITALQFLGIGNPLSVSWGSILYWAQSYAFDYKDWWWILAPGLIISLTAAGFGLIGFRLEEVFNPKLKA